MIKLHSYQHAFSQGGNRYCFITPKAQPSSYYCIKLPRVDRSPQIRRAEKPLIKQLKPLSSFNENYQEYKVYQAINKFIGEAAYQLIPRCYGFVDTDLGKGLKFDLITDYDNKVSISLKQYLWLNQRDHLVEQAIATFKTQWQQLGMPSRDLLLHNIVVQKINPEQFRLVVIDGLGWPTIMSYCYIIPPLAKRKAARKLQNMEQRIQQILTQKSDNIAWGGHHGWLNDNQRVIHESTNH